LRLRFSSISSETVFDSLSQHTGLYSITTASSKGKHVSSVCIVAYAWHVLTNQIIWS